MNFNIFLLVLAGFPGLLSAQNNSSSSDEHIKSITSVSKVFGDGCKVTSIILEYDANIASSSLSLSTYMVNDHEILDVYTCSEPYPESRSTDGKYVMIELKAEVDINSQPKAMTPEQEELKAKTAREHGGPGLKAGWSTGGDDVYQTDVTVLQKEDIMTADGKTYTSTNFQWSSSEDKYLIADNFRQFEFNSPYTGQILPYNLYIPDDCDSGQKYPLVLFIHDAGVASAPVTQTLYQGTGAVIWASPEVQSEHKCFVLAPQYPVVTVDDNWNYSHHLDATIALIKELERQYPIDPDRIYTTGQSMGCMSSIVMMLKEPDLFAGALLVAGKWNPEVMAPLASQNIWIVSCEGDASSSELQSKAVAIWREGGAEVAEDTWEIDASQEEFDENVKAMEDPDIHLYFTHLTGGSHRSTWVVAYGIKGIRDWLLNQHRQDSVGKNR